MKEDNLKRTHSVNSICMTPWQRKNYTDSKLIIGCRSVGSGVREAGTDEAQGILYNDETIFSGR